MVEATRAQPLVRTVVISDRLHEAQDRGVALELGPEDVDPQVISHARVTYLEGYLWDPPRAKQAFIKAAEGDLLSAGDPRFAGAA